jgi:phage terminase Nu1 subunit (DNA packaging protein)
VPTLKVIGNHLDMSERNAGTICQNLGLNRETSSLDEIRTTYIRDLREKAAGRGGDAQGELVLARIRETNTNADLKELMVKEKAGQLVNVDDIEPQLVAMVTAAKQELLSLPEKVASDIKAMHGIDVDVSLIQERINDSLKQLATSLHANDAGDDVESDEAMVTAAEVDDD